MQFRFHLNTRNMLIRDDHMGDGSIDQAAIYVREVIRRAIDFGSAALILVHNHPTEVFSSTHNPAYSRVFA